MNLLRDFLFWCAMCKLSYLLIYFNQILYYVRLYNEFLDDESYIDVGELVYVSSSLGAGGSCSCAGVE